jgi:hypothetical protein
MRFASLRSLIGFLFLLMLASSPVRAEEPYPDQCKTPQDCEVYKPCCSTACRGIAKKTSGKYKATQEGRCAKKKCAPMPEPNNCAWIPACIAGHCVLLNPDNMPGSH